MLAELVAKNIDILICPSCGRSLKNSDQNTLSCPNRDHTFSSPEDIPLLFWPNDWEGQKDDTTNTIKSFYEKFPFPNYDDTDSVEQLRAKAKNGIFARLLDEQIPFGSVVLEVGCGTGQLSNFLASSWGKKVFGIDLCLNSLKLGDTFKNKNRIKNIAFIQMNLFKPAFKPETFDYVICNGVLHHTSNPFLGFQTIAKLVKKNGFIVIGLYNKFSRIPTHFRRFWFRISGNRYKFLDHHLRRNDIGEVKKNSWFMDQYQNPHESAHTIDEVVRWFSHEGFTFMNSIPKTTPLANFTNKEKLFEPHPLGTKMDHLVAQLLGIFSGSKEGGFFLITGRKHG